TAAAARLPGLCAALHEQVVQPPAEAELSDDFGEHLLAADTEPVRWTLLAPDALARAAHALACCLDDRQPRYGHLDQAVPLLPALGGPARVRPAAGHRRLGSIA